MVEECTPRYPAAQVTWKSRKPLALLAATRFALRRAGVPREEMDRFLADASAAEAAGGGDTLEGVCARWARLEQRNH